jgi:hypothetical protein
MSSGAGSAIAVLLPFRAAGFFLAAAACSCHRQLRSGLLLVSAHFIFLIFAMSLRSDLFSFLAASIEGLTSHNHLLY